MAKSAAPRRPSSPVKQLQTRLMETMARGADPAHMTRAVDAGVETLRAEGSPDEVQDWLEELRDGFAESTEAAIEAIEEVESTEKAARRHAETAAQSMAACRDAFARHLRVAVPA